MDPEGKPIVYVKNVLYVCAQHGRTGHNGIQILHIKVTPDLDPLYVGGELHAIVFLMIFCAVRLSMNITEERPFSQKTKKI